MDRYRVIVSDGEHFLQSMLATQLNHLVEEEQILKHSIAVIEKFTCNLVQGKKLLIILALRVVQKEAEKIGNPVGIQARAGGSIEAQASPSAAVTPAPAASTKPAVSAAPAQSSRQPTQGNRGGRTAIYPIESLSPYQNHWTIKARVISKSEIRTWSNQRGEGKLFNITLMDESGEIRATGFNATVDELYDRIQEGKVYFISKAKVNLAKKKFSNIANEYELALERNTEIEECPDAADVPTVKFNFTPIANLQEIAKDAVCDIVGVVKEVGELSSITSKATSKQIPKKELTVVDASGFSVKVTLWGKQAEQYNEVDYPVIAFKGAKVGDFQGRSLSMMSSSSLIINPDIPEAHHLRGWYDAAGAEQTYQSHTNTMSSGGGVSFDRAEIRSLNDVKTSELGMSDKVDTFSSRATIMHIKGDNIAYPACPSQGCNKKVVLMGDSWRCENCDKSYPQPEHRYIVPMAVADYSGQAWFQGFNDVGLIVFGMPANDLVAIKERDDTEFNRVLEGTIGTTYNFACRAKQDNYNDQARVRYGISRILPLDYREEATYLANLLRRSEWSN
ncbi:replication factor-a protein [Trametes versicolor FP-101664 SS1]|uniref:replication factor-a protein n=1 Tax=Trametes versicolor (strain FP-101664) TaxID=717944 RepID=UPI000462210F|nr:replication factor-a protein [Trametes versicolor FP-101664 SS1]EIW60181.1 replication factor-a protein [Trametes versicolor FP-101664 SS1]